MQATSTPTDIEGYASTGDTVVYTLTVINEGTVTVHDIGLDVLQVSDRFALLKYSPYANCPGISVLDVKNCCHKTQPLEYN